MVCNKTQKYRDVFIATASIVGQNIRVQGWWQVRRGQCTELGEFERPSVFWHASAESATWVSNPDSKICVHPKNGFDYNWSEKRGCQSGEVPVGFEKLDVGPTVPTFRLSLN